MSYPSAEIGTGSSAALGTGALVIARSDFNIEDPWAIPPPSNPVRLRRATDGQVPRLATTFSAYYDDDYLNIVFSSADDHVRATFFGHDDPLYEQDVVEVFLAPNSVEEYFEIEVSPVGTVFDARIVSPDGVRRTLRADPSWNCSGLIAAVRKVVESDGTMTIDTLLRIPFVSLGRAMPRDHETWRANFFRIDRHPAGDEYSAWRPTMKIPADFHITAAFGSISFHQ